MRTALGICGILILAARLVCAGDVTGEVHDASDHRPIAGAVLTIGDRFIRAGPDGNFRLAARRGDQLLIRASGYEKAALKIDRTDAIDIQLARTSVKALYLTVYGIGSKQLRENALSLIEKTELNALVIDLKGDAGIVPFPAAAIPAKEAGARKITTLPDLADFAARMHALHIYLIARIVVFKDNPLASYKPALAVKAASGAVWHDREGLAWVDPFKQEVRDYNLALAEEAAQAGFDEIQFDYLRFPDAPGLKFSDELTAQSREAAIGLLLDQARQRLARYNVFIAADVFGYICWNLNDTGIGQRIESLAPKLDYISPMLYPSGFQFGIPGFRNPVEHSFDIVSRSLARARERTQLPGRYFRPWLQAFRDYGFDHREFGAGEIRDQIRGAGDSGSNGWMLWNARNQYTGAGLMPKR